MDDKEKLINETLLEADSYTGKLIIGINNYLESIDSGNSSSVSGLLVDITNGIEWLFSALSLLDKELQNAFETSEHNKLFSEINTAINNKDVVMLGDLFRYELLPVLNDWKNKMDNDISIRKLND